MRTLNEIGEKAVGPAHGHRGEALHVEAGAEAAARAMEHDGAQVLAGDEALARFDQRCKHGRVERIELVRPVEPHFGDAGLDGDCDPAADGLAFPHLRLPGPFEPSRRTPIKGNSRPHPRLAVEAHMRLAPS